MPPQISAMRDGGPASLEKRDADLSCDQGDPTGREYRPGRSEYRDGREYRGREYRGREYRDGGREYRDGANTGTGAIEYRSRPCFSDRPDRQPGPCPFCTNGVPELLQAGSKLWVVYPTATGSGVGYFVGGKPGFHIP